jgi:type II secretory pathway component GspD/PulD (secretin)
MNASFGPWSSASTEKDHTAVPGTTSPSVSRLFQAVARRLAAVALALGVVAVAVAWQPLVSDSRAQSKEDPRATHAPPLEVLPDWNPIERRIVDALEKPVTWNFTELSLREVVHSVRKETGINVILDRTGLEVVSVDDNTPITLQVKELRLGAALRLLLRPLSLCYQIRDDVLLITDEEGAARELMLRVYPVTDLMAKEDDAEPLIEALINTVRSDTWEDNGGIGTLAYIPASGALVVSQTSAIHREIVELFRALREAKQFRRTVYAK